MDVLIDARPLTAGSRAVHCAPGDAICVVRGSYAHACGGLFLTVCGSVHCVQRMLSGRVPAAQATVDPVRPKEASTWAEGLFLWDFTRPIGATRMVARSD